LINAKCLGLFRDRAHGSYSLFLRNEGLTIAIYVRFSAIGPSIHSIELCSNDLLLVSRGQI